MTALIKIKSYLTSVSRIDRSLYISRYVSIFLNTLLTIVNVNCRIEAEAVGGNVAMLRLPHRPAPRR